MQCLSKKYFKKINIQAIKLLLVLSFSFFYSTNSFSQLPTFNWVLEGKATDPSQTGDRSHFHDMVQDNSENTIVCGGYRGTVQFGEGATAITRTSGVKGNFQPNKDIVILKMNPAGDLLWDITIGDNANHNIARSVDVDDAGNIYVIGIFEGTVDFDPSGSVNNLVSTSTFGGDIFVAKYDANGEYIWAFAIQGNHWRQDAYDIDVNSESGHFILGVELNTPVDLDPFNPNNIAYPTTGEDAAILVYDLSGNLVFGQNYNDSSSAGISSVYMDDNGDSYVFVGSINGIDDIDPTSDVVNIPDNNVGVLIKYDIAGNLMWYETYNVSNNQLYPGGIEVDNCGDIIVAATYFDISSISYEAFVAKFDSTGAIQWDQHSMSSNGSTYLGAVPFDEYRNGGLAVDKNNNIYVMGSTGETNSPISMTFGTLSISNSSPNGYIGYMTKFDTDGNSIYLEKIQTDGSPYYYNINMYVSKQNTVSICGYGVIPIDIPFGGGLTGTNTYTSYLMIFSQDTTSLNLCEEDCMGVINGLSILDSCGVCLLPTDSTFNQSCTDCAGVINGNAVLDSCGVCLVPTDPNFNQNCTDCAGVINGNSILDSCGVCLVPTDPNFNQNCTDCAGVINGNAILDSCGVCLVPTDPNFNQNCTDCAGVI
ncbi:MAG: SBBP repeat-containing protein, partial [Saprospiraceae bacterium]